MKKHYKAEITININDKGVIDLDTVKGYTLGIRDNSEGCYGLCYAKKCADFRGIDFGISVSRMPSERALKEILKTIKIAENCKSKCCKKFKKGEDKRCTRCPQFDLTKKKS